MRQEAGLITAVAQILVDRKAPLLSICCRPSSAPFCAREPAQCARCWAEGMVRLVSAASKALRRRSA